MMKSVFFLFLICVVPKLFAGPNCEAYKYSGDLTKYKACKKAEEANEFFQYSKEFQEVLNQSINIDSTYAFAYQQKSVAYLKSGDFITWKKLIDKAVKFNPNENLGYRAWCRYQFFRDYRGAIKDIELLDSLVNYNIGFSANGDYHLNIVKALCYKSIGQNEKAILIIENQFIDENHFIGLYDYLHLGVLYFDEGDFQRALVAFKKQSVENELAENQFYLALVCKALKMKTEYQSSLKMAEKLYLDNRKMYDHYTNPMDKIYLDNIESEKNSLK